MRKVLIVALGIASAVASAQLTYAKSLCDAQRDACYSETSRSDREARHGCRAAYDRCISTDISAPTAPVVRTVPGLGAPMVQPYPTAAAPVNAGTAASNAAAVNAAQSGQGGSVRAIGNLVIVSPSPPTTSPPVTTTGTSSHSAPSASGGAATLGGASSQGGTSSQGSGSVSQGGASSGGGASGGSGGGSSGHLRVN